jgi:hypothetical protein
MPAEGINARKKWSGLFNRTNRLSSAFSFNIRAKINTSILDRELHNAATRVNAVSQL